jgi:hypothetical protein
MTADAEEYTFWVTIDSAGSCHGVLLNGDRFISTCSGGSLRPDTTLVVKGKPLTCKELTRRLINYKLNNPDLIFDERGQLEIGRHLFTQIAGTMADEQKREVLKAKVAVRIVTEDETAARLPWCLLVERRDFLVAGDWSVAFSLPHNECLDRTLPSNPRILIVAPCPIDRTTTEAKEHLNELEDQVWSGVNDAYTYGKSLKVVESWDEFVAELESFLPHIVYYYGHGHGDENSSRLVFKKAGEWESDEVPVSNFAHALKRLKGDAPLIAYINCCQGDAGGSLGVSKQLGEFVPAVITNCTTAYVDAARKQALEIWKGLLLDRKSPHEAVSAIRINLDKVGLFFKDLRWITPILHYSYKRWSYEPHGFEQSTSDHSLNLDFNWRHKLNRTKQFFEVMERMEWVMHRPGARSFAFLAFGQKGQGFLDFYRRVEVELPLRISGTWLPPIRPAWPLEFSGNYYRSFSERLCEAFKVSSLNDIPNNLSGVHDEIRKFLLIEHSPVELPVEGDLPNKYLYRLQAYLQWLNNKFVMILPDNIFLLIGFSFAVPVPDTFKARASEILVRGLSLDRIRFSLLDQLTSVTVQELESFLETYDMLPPKEHISDVIQKIINRTGGVYEHVVEQVKNIDEYSLFI